MKRFLTLLFGLCILIIGISGGKIRGEVNKTMIEQFPDQVLRSEISLILNKSDTDYITATDASEIRSLIINDRGIKSLEGIGIFKNIIYLDASNNEIDKIPSDIANLKNLRILVLNNNKLSSIDDSVMNLVNLEVLSANGNSITKLSNKIGNLTKLEQLQLQNNLLTTLPKELYSLKSLEMLVLEANLIEELPKEIGNLNNLTILDMGNNRLESIPWELGNLDKIYFLDFSANRIHNIEIHLYNQLQAIKAVYLYNQFYSEKIINTGIVLQDLKIKGLEIYTLDLGFDIKQTLIKPDGTEVILNGIIHGDMAIIPAEDLDLPGNYILRTTIEGGPVNSFGDVDKVASVYEQSFSIKEYKKLPDDDRLIYLYVSLIAFCSGLTLLVISRIFKSRGGF